jgi:uncharacterized phage-associated protein
MANVHDVAAYILAKQSSMSTWKLQKLTFYSQAWHLAWNEKPLFSARIEAWANGPVVPDLYDGHRGKFSVGVWSRGDQAKLTKSDRATIDRVLAAYGNLDGRQLSLLTHSERPWLEARGSLAPTALSNSEITPESMQTFYAALDADGEAQPVEQIDWAALESD